MDLEKTLKEINSGREKAECAFVFCCWNNPEFFDNYSRVNEGKDTTLQNEDSQFYWSLGKAMYKQGLRKFDAISIDTFLTNKDNVRSKFESLGGIQTVKELTSLVHDDNVEAYFDIIAKKNSLQILAKKTDELFNDVGRFENASNEDVYEAWEQINNTVSINTNYGERIESLSLEDDFIDQLEKGEDVGYNYGKYCPALNYITLGCAPGSMYMIGGYSGGGKTSMTFENILMSLHYQEDVGKIGIISNEMKIQAYKHLLLIHILTKDMGYYELTRKKLKIGKFTPEQKEKIKEAIQISKEKYSDFLFVKIFDNDISKILKYIKQMHGMGASVIMYDTFKVTDGIENKSVWESLLLDSRKIFQLASKLNICILTPYQLALHTQNIRYLDATCLSNAKQIKEVYETMIYIRPLWSDEFNGEKFDVKPWRFKKDNNYQYVTDENGKRIKETIKLDPNEKYIVVFVDKTRADDDKQMLLYRWRGRFNDWREEGYCTVKNMHIYN